MIYEVIWPPVEERKHPRKNRNLPDEVEIPDEINNREQSYDAFRREASAWLEETYGELPDTFHRPARFYNYHDE